MRQDMNADLVRVLVAVRQRALLLGLLTFCIAGIVLIGAVSLRYLEYDAAQAEKARNEALFARGNFTAEQIDLLRTLGAVKGLDEPAEQWSYMSSAFFCLTVVTTIGYGNLTPITTSGRWFTALYAVVGTAFVGITLSKTASILLEILGAATHLIKILVSPKKLNSKGTLTEDERKRVVLTFEEIDRDGSGFIDRAELSEMMKRLNNGLAPSPEDVEMVFAQADVDHSNHISQDELLIAVCAWYQHLMEKPQPMNYAQLLVGVSLILMLLLGGAFWYQHIEDWTYSDAAWFCFVTLTTIGFGDVVPRTRAGQLLTMFFSFAGLGLLAYVIATIAQIFSQMADQARKNINRRRAASRAKQFAGTEDEDTTPLVSPVEKMCRDG